jgi:CUG-BP- and ETR3-like factor
MRLSQVFLMREKDGRSKGCAFVRYYSQQDADRACETLHNTVALPGCLRALVVKYADSEPRASKQQPSHGAVPGYYPLQAPAGSQRFLGESQWVGMPGGGMGHLITPMHSPAMMGGMRMLPMGMLPAIDSQYYLPPRVVMPNGATYPVQTPFVSGMGGMGMGGMGMGGMGMDGMGMGRMPLSDLHCAEQQTHSFAPSFAPGRGFSPAGTPMSPMSPPPFAMWAPSAAASQPDSLNLLERQLSATSFSAGTPAEGARRGACWDRISVTNLPRHMQEADIHQLFAPFGMVQVRQR